MMSNEKLSDAFTALNDIEAFVKVRCTLGFAEEVPLRVKAQLQTRGIGDTWKGDLSPPALEAIQHAYMSRDLLTTFGRSDRLSDWTTTCLAHIAKLRLLLTRLDAAPHGGIVPFCQPARNCL